MSGRRVRVPDLRHKKQAGEKIAMLTAYDATMARLFDRAGIDVILVGDSLASVILGHQHTLTVTLDAMIHHTGAVARGTEHALVVTDMPFLTYQVSVEDAMRNCARVMRETAAQSVKLEGGGPEIIAAVEALTRSGIPVMGQLGFTPQSVNTIGGFRVQGREPDAAQKLRDEAKRLEDAGAYAVVLELVPADLAREVSESLHMPTIGIGAGGGCDGQVLVLMDMLGLNDRFKPKFLKKYARLADEVRSAVREFGTEVREKRYPGTEHSF